MQANNGTNGHQREKVSFPPNEPVLLTLDFSDGELVPGKFGDQFKYTFDNSTRIAWLDPEVRELIRKTGARAGDDIAITKREIKTGNRKRAAWEVEKVQDEACPFGPTAAEERAAEEARARPATRSAAPQPAPQKPAAAPAADPHSEAVSQAAQTFAECIAAAVEAARISAAAAHAQASPFALPWDKADIRAIATTLYIQRAGRGGQ